MRLMTIPLFLLVMSCAAIPVSDRRDVETSNRQEEDKTFIPDRKTLEPSNQQELEAKYSRLVGSISEELIYNCPSCTQLVEYGNSIKQFKEKDYNELTIYSDVYWNAFFAIAPDNPDVYFSRVHLLMREGLLEQAFYTLIFITYQANTIIERNEITFLAVQKDIESVKTNSAKYIRNGIKQYDSGSYTKAIDEYNKALSIYPKSPPALYQTGMTYMAKHLQEKGEEEQAKEIAFEYYEKARTYDPFYHMAYQGPEAIAQKMSIVSGKIQPAVKELLSRKVSEEILLEFAAGCEEIGVYEFSIYAYHLLLALAYDDTVNADIVDKIAICLKKLGVENAANEFKSQIQAINQNN